MRVGRQVLDDGADLQRPAGRGELQQDRTADHIFAAEQFLRKAPGNDQHVRFRQGGIGVTGQGPGREHPEEVRLCAAQVRPDRDVGLFEVPAACPQPGHCLYFREIQLQPGPESLICAADGCTGRAIDDHGQTVRLLGVGIHAVITELIAHKQRDQNDRGETQRETQNVDDGIDAVAHEIAKRGGDIVAKHLRYRLRSVDETPVEHVHDPIGAVACDSECVTMITVVPARLLRVSISITASPLAGVEVAGGLVGQDQTSGSETRARATATRCCWPPESCCGTMLGAVADADPFQRLRHPAAALAAGTPR